MRRDRRKDLYRTERNFLEGPHEEAEIQRKAFRRGKNLAFSEDTCLEKERMRSKVTPRNPTPSEGIFTKIFHIRKYFVIVACLAFDPFSFITLSSLLFCHNFTTSYNFLW